MRDSGPAVPVGQLHTVARAGGHSQGCVHERSASDRSKPPEPSPFWSFLTRERGWQVGKFLCTSTSVRTGGFCCGQTLPKPQLLATRPISYSMTCPWWVAGSPRPRWLEALLSQTRQKVVVVSPHWLLVAPLLRACVTWHTYVWCSNAHGSHGLLGDPGAFTLPCPLPATVPDGGCL